MSADNYYYIRKHHGEFAVSDESASDEKPRRLRHHKFLAFTTFAEAWQYANKQDAEYGVRTSRELEPQTHREDED